MSEVPLYSGLMPPRLKVYSGLVVRTVSGRARLWREPKSSVFRLDVGRV